MSLTYLYLQYLLGHTEMAPSLTHRHISRITDALHAYERGDMELYRYYCETLEGYDICMPNVNGKYI